MIHNFLQLKLWHWQRHEQQIATNLSVCVWCTLLSTILYCQLPIIILMYLVQTVHTSSLLYSSNSTSGKNITSMYYYQPYLFSTYLHTLHTYIYYIKLKLHNSTNTQPSRTFHITMVFVLVAFNPSNYYNVIRNDNVGIMPKYLKFLCHLCMRIHRLDIG